MVLAKKNVLKQKIAWFLAKQKIGVLATVDNEGPYGSLVAFTVYDNLKNIIFATGRGTRKYSNIKTKSAVALLVDDRVNTNDDFYKTTAITILGDTVETSGKERRRLLTEHRKRHAAIRAFLALDTCAVFRIKVSDYVVINNFDNVEKLTL
jgi:nitroimidazol reductase NimA-like FMN-containing flavoprotein (pyridoxamine 5'-phosphate oxidase superfamily)